MDAYSIYPKQFNNEFFKIKNDMCFVIMPFASAFDNTYLVIESVSNSMDIICTRADNISMTSEPILHKICAQIAQSYYIIVDISGLNPNVFYELGIAHVLRDARRVLIIKDEETECPSDIKHLHYFPYNKSNLKLLKETIAKFFTENNILEDLQDVLTLLDLLPTDNVLAQKYVVELTNCIGNSISDLVLVLNNKANEVQYDRADLLLKRLIDYLNKMSRTDACYELYSNMLLLVISKIVGTVNISSFVAGLFNGKNNSISNEWLADCSIVVLDDPLYFHDAIVWIIKYLEKISPAEFDLVKYKIEIGIIKSKSSQIDTVLVDKLNSSNKTLSEHCAKLIKERKTYAAIPALLKLIENDRNPYVVRSCIDALISIAPLSILLDAKKAIDQRTQFVKENPFIEKHLLDLTKQISYLQDTANYGKI